MHGDTGDFFQVPRSQNDLETLYFIIIIEIFIMLLHTFTLVALVKPLASKRVELWCCLSLVNIVLIKLEGQTCSKKKKPATLSVVEGTRLPPGQPM